MRPRSQCRSVAQDRFSFTLVKPPLTRSSKQRFHLLCHMYVVDFEVSTFGYACSPSRYFRASLGQWASGVVSGGAKNSKACFIPSTVHNLIPDGDPMNENPKEAHRYFGRGKSQNTPKPLRLHLAPFSRGVPVDVRDNHGNTVLIIACQNGHKRALKAALRRGADPNARNSLGNTGLHFCHAFGGQKRAFSTRRVTAYTFSDLKAKIF